MALKKKFVPKYVAKIPTSMGQYRYFYTQAEYQSYLAGKNRKMTVKTPIHRPTAKLNTSVMPSNAKLVKAAKAQSSASNSSASPAVKSILSKYIKTSNKSDETKARVGKKHDPTKQKQKIGTTVKSKMQSSKGDDTTAAKKYVDLINGAKKSIAPFTRLFGVLNKTNTNITDAQDMEDTNPDYGKGDKWSYNCSYCTMAYELRRRGYDVEAKGAYKEDGSWTSGTTIDDIANVYKNADVKQAKDLLDLTPDPSKVGITSEGRVSIHDSNMSNSEITRIVETDMLQHGEGARGMFGVQWGFFGTAHAMVWEVENGSVVIKDPQTNTSNTLEHYMKQINDFTYFRTDNLEITEKVTDYVQNAREVPYDDSPKRSRFGGY